MTGGAFACAVNVAVGQLGSGGGFAGYNEGIITCRLDRARTAPPDCPTPSRATCSTTPRTVRRREPGTDFAFICHGQRRHRRHDAGLGSRLRRSNKGTIRLVVRERHGDGGRHRMAGGFVSDNSPGSGSQTPSCVDEPPLRRRLQQQRRDHQRASLRRRHSRRIERRRRLRRCIGGGNHGQKRRKG